MGQANVIISAQDNASSVIDHVTKKLGLFNKEGIALGISFAITNKAIQLLQEGFQRLVQGITDSIHRQMELQLNIVRLTNVIDNMDMSVGNLKDSLSELSTTFGVDINILASQMALFARQGYSASESLRLVSESQKFAIATGEDFNSIVDAINTTMEVFDMDASDSAYILKEFNDIVDETGMSTQNISDIFARASPNIRESGYSLEDIVNVLYTLSKEGDAPRTMLSEINDVLKDMEGRKIDILPEDQVKTIEDKYADVDKTSTKFWDKAGQAALDFGGALVDNVGGSFDYVMNILNKGWLPDKYRIQPPTQLASIAPVRTDWMDDYIKKTAALNKQITDLNVKITDETTKLADLDQEHQRGLTQMDFTVATRSATLAVQDQEDAIEKLRRVSNLYSLEQQANSLEIMKIQYGGMGTRRGITRGQQRQIESIEKTNMGIRIKETEQQLAINNIQVNGLQIAQDKLNAIKRAYDTEMYNQGIEDLTAHINTVYSMWSAMYQQLAIDQAALIARQTSLSSISAPPTVDWSNMHQTGNAFQPFAPNTAANATSVVVNVNNPVVNNQADISRLLRRGMSRGVLDMFGNTNARMR